MFLCALYLITGQKDKTDDVVLVENGKLNTKREKGEIDRRNGRVE
jgi:hypothetical protein